jgi:hypothetical protein
VELRRLRHMAAAVWLGVLALALQSLVPVHLAFDIAEALDQERAPAHGTGELKARDILAALTGHQDHNKRPGGAAGRGAPDCTVCGSLGVLGALAPPALAVIPLPGAMQAAAALPASPVEPAGSLPPAYRSRAPPIG